MATAKVFKTGRSQAVRLPKECRFNTREVRAAKVDDMVILYSPRQGWKIMERAIRHFTDDFMAERNQPSKTEKRVVL
jgi:antitoxin VapB